MCVLNFDQVSIVICIHLESSLVLLNHLLKKKEKKKALPQQKLKLPAYICVQIHLSLCCIFTKVCPSIWLWVIKCLFVKLPSILELP